MNHFLPDPRFPTTADLARRAASLPCPCIISVVGQDLAIHAVAGDLATLVNATPGTYLIDRPLPTAIRRLTLHHMLRALLGSVQTYDVTAHGHCWRTTLAPIPTPDLEESDPTRQVIGVLSTSIIVPALVAPEAPEDDLIECYTALQDDGELIRAGDVLSCRHSGVVCKTESIPQRAFDHALARGILAPGIVPLDGVRRAASSRTSPSPRSARPGDALRALRMRLV